MTSGRRILLGRVAGAFGVRGELKVVSWTEPRDALFRYQPWILRAGESEREIEGARGRETAKGIVARLPGVETRDDAEAMTGTEIWVPRERLPEPAPGEYYWVDLALGRAGAKDPRLVAEQGIARLGPGNDLELATDAEGAGDPAQQDAAPGGHRCIGPARRRDRRLRPRPGPRLP